MESPERRNFGVSRRFRAADSVLLSIEGQRLAQEEAVSTEGHSYCLASLMMLRRC